MIIYTEKKDTFKKLLEFINELGKTEGYMKFLQVNMQKSIAFLYNNNKLSEKEIKETSHSPSHQKE